MRNYETIGLKLNELSQAAEKATEVHELKALIKALVSVVASINYEAKINHNVIARHLNGHD